MSVVTGLTERSRSFGAQAELYDRLRPGYPPGALDAVLPRGARHIADVGAGTGKLTAALAARGLAVIAVEPDAAMRAVLARRLPQVDVRGGAAEALPLSDGEVDAVLFAQAWHWTDPERAAGETLRVLARGGTLGMLWNLLDDGCAWVAELDRLTVTDACITGFPDPPALAGFTAGRRVDVAWRQTLSKYELVDLARTWSMVSTRPPAERDQVLGCVCHLLSTHPELAAQDTIDLPYVCTTRTYRSARADDA
jgi:SAM-dependent methyltransferase